MAFVDDGFGGEDLDDLLSEDLEALERSAIQSTQAKSAFTSRPKAETVNKIARTGQTLVPTSFADFDDEVINGTEGEDDLIGGGNQYAQHLIRSQLRAVDNVAATISPRRHGLVARNGEDKNKLSKPLPSSEDSGSEDDLHRQIKDLLLERDRLQAAVQDANRQVFTKSGEIAVVRANNQRMLKERDQKILDLERDLKVADEKHNSDLELAKRQQDQLATESHFADHDRVVNRTRQRRAAPVSTQEDVVVLRPASKAIAQVSTPRKQHRGMRGDGFDMQERSPARSSPHIRDVTPGAVDKKRKRTVVASPTRAEDTFDEAHSADQEATFLGDETNEQDDPTLEEIRRQAADERFDLLQAFLGRQAEWDQRRTIEVLSAYYFPSEQETPLSTLVYDEVDKISATGPEGPFATALGSMIVSLWRRCLAEKYYRPIAYLIDHLAGLLASNSAVVGALIEDIVPLAQNTGDINIVPRFKKQRRQKTNNDASTAAIITDPLAQSSEISVSACLHLLLLIAASVDDYEAKEASRMWKLMRFDFASMLLRPSQDPEDVLLMARLLQHSVRLDGFGSIIDPLRPRSPQVQTAVTIFDQTRSEDHLLDRLTSMLIETPKAPDGDPEAYADYLVCEVRLEILGTLSCLAANMHAVRLIAAHPLAVGRLVRCAADSYYNAMQSSPGSSSALTLHLVIVGEAIRLVYHLVNAHSVDINAKLVKIRGGPQLYLVVLTRLVFSEGTLYGEEIDEDVVECAHALLEDFVSPEEGEMIMDMAEDEE